MISLVQLLSLIEVNLKVRKWFQTPPHSVKKERSNSHLLCYKNSPLVTKLIRNISNLVCMIPLFTITPFFRNSKFWNRKQKWWSLCTSSSLNNLKKVEIFLTKKCTKRDSDTENSKHQLLLFSLKIVQKKRNLVKLDLIFKLQIFYLRWRFNFKFKSL